MSDNDLIYRLAKEHEIQASGLAALLMPQTLDVAMAVKGLDGRYRLTNKAMQELFGWDADQMVKLTDADLFPIALADRLKQSDQELINGKTITSDDLDLVIDGETVQCVLTKFPLHGPDGQLRLIGVVMLNLAGPGSIEKLRESLELLKKTNQELQDTLVELDRQASTDKLTGAWNRRRLEEALLGEMDRLRRYDHPLSLLVVDIDFFKKINDNHGHNTGDKVLAQLVRVVQPNLRATDSLTRWGGEEFVILCPNTPLSTAVVLAERLRQSIGNSEFPEVGHVTVSIGVAECEAGEGWDEWFRRADVAMYRAKAMGRNNVQVAPESPQARRHGENVAANFVNLTWHSAYESGHRLIDEQHRALFSDANELLGSILSGRPQDEVSLMVERLIADVVQHFRDEEAILDAIPYPGAAEHAAIHRSMIDNATALVAHFRSGQLAIGELFKFLAHDLVARHMLGADRDYFPYLKSALA